MTSRFRHPAKTGNAPFNDSGTRPRCYEVAVLINTSEQRPSPADLVEGQRNVVGGLPRLPGK